MDSDNITSSNSVLPNNNNHHKPSTPTPTQTPLQPQSFSSTNTIITNTNFSQKHKTKMLTLWVHPDVYPNNAYLKQPDLILNPDYVPGIVPGQLLEIYPSNENYDVTKHLILKVGSFDKESIKQEKPILQVIIFFF